MVYDIVTIDANEMDSDQTRSPSWIRHIERLKMMEPNFKNTTFVITSKYDYNVNNPDEEAVFIRPIKNSESISYRKLAYDGTTRYQVKTKWLRKNAQFEPGQEVQGKEKANLFDLI